jgi:hypothetical protein
MDYWEVVELGSVWLGMLYKEQTQLTMNCNLKIHLSSFLLSFSSICQISKKLTSTSSQAVFSSCPTETV